MSQETTHPSPDTRIVTVGSRPTEQRAIKKRLNLGFIFKWAARGQGALIVAAALAFGPLGSDTVGLIESYNTRGASSDLIEATAEEVQEVRLPSSPFVEAGRFKDGNLGLQRMVALWERAGLSHDDMLQVAKLHDPLGPAWVGTRDPGKIKELQRQAGVALATLEADYPEAWKKLSDRQWVAKNSTAPTTKSSRDVVRHLAREVYFPEDTENRKRYPGQMDNTEESRRAVGIAMKQAGFRSLQRSFLQGHTAAGMMDTAHWLVSSNQKLLERTKWTGAVMGLGGRVDVVVNRGKPGEYYAAATPKLVYDRAVQQRAQVIILGQPASYFHELAHALDFVLARQSYHFNTNANTLSESMHELNDSMWKGLKWRRDGGVEQAMGRVMAGLGAAAPDWQAARSQEARDSGNDYWTRHNEAFAFAFAGQMGQKDQEGDPWRTPSQRESQQQAALFDRLFADLERLDLGGRPQSPASKAKTRVNIEGVKPLQKTTAHPKTAHP